MKPWRDQAAGAGEEGWDIDSSARGHQTGTRRSDKTCSLTMGLLTYRLPSCTRLQRP